MTITISKRFILVAITLLVIASIAAECSNPDAVESQNVKRQQQLYVNSQPAPYFEWSLERHLMTELYKARNNAVSTFSLTFNDFRGAISWSCASIGFPIPGGTQLTNPQQYVVSGAVLPQAEPNGLFTPATSAGTYVMCVNKDGTVSPTYIEDNVRTFPQPMVVQDGQLVPAANATPSIKIKPSQ